jgi:hypothetical protein
MRIPQALLCVTVAIALAACSDDPITPADPCTDNTGSVTVTVTSAAGVPVFDWSPSCAVAFVLVEEDASDIWFVGTDDSNWDDPAQVNLFTPPITYGVAPSGTADEYGPDPLVTGVEYDFILWRVPPGSTADCLAEAFGACMLANHQFTP